MQAGQRVALDRCGRWGVRVAQRTEGAMGQPPGRGPRQRRSAHRDLHLGERQGEVSPGHAYQGRPPSLIPTTLLVAWMWCLPPRPTGAARGSRAGRPRPWRARRHCRPGVRRTVVALSQPRRRTMTTTTMIRIRTIVPTLMNMAGSSSAGGSRPRPGAMSCFRCPGGSVPVFTGCGTAPCPSRRRRRSSASAPARNAG